MSNNTTNEGNYQLDLSLNHNLNPLPTQDDSRIYG